MIGLDLGPAYLANAEALVQREGPGNAAFEGRDVQAMQFAAASFDLVWSKYVLYFPPRPGRRRRVPAAGQFCPTWKCPAVGEPQPSRSRNVSSYRCLGHIGGTSPFCPTRTLFAVTVPSGARVALTSTLAFGVSALRSAGA